MDPYEIGLAACIIFFAHIIKGATGFANALIAIPLLSIFMDIKFVVPMFLLFDFPSSGMIAIKHRDAIKWRTALIVFSGLFIGTTIGAYVLINLSNSYLKLLFGIVVALFGVHLIVKDQMVRPSSWKWKWGVLSGLLGGTAGGMFGMDGPLVVMYLSRVLHKTSFRATITTIFLMSSFWRGSLYVYGGVLELDQVWFALMMTPFLVTGILAGSHLQNKLDQRSFNRIIGVVLVIAGIMLVV